MVSESLSFIKDAFNSYQMKTTINLKNIDFELAQENFYYELKMIGNYRNNQFLLFLKRVVVKIIYYVRFLQMNYDDDTIFIYLCFYKNQAY
jgi:hypothetical protein